MVSLNQRTMLRAYAQRWMTDTVTVLTHSAADGVNGNDPTDGWTVTATVGGWLRQMNTPPLDATAQGFIGAAESLRLLLPFDTIINIGDHAAINGKTYTVSSTNGDDTNRISMVCTVRDVESS